MILRAIILDDELNAVISLALLIRNFVPEITVTAKTTSPTEGISLINELKPDIVFMDIKMPHLGGFDVLEKLQFRDFHLVFTTAYHEYALQALKKNATDFLLKPVNFEELKDTTRRIQQKITEKQKIQNVTELIKDLIQYRQLKVPVHTKSSIEYVLPENVVYIEASGRKTLIKLKDKTYISSITALKQYDEILCRTNLPFMRVHHSFIINMNHITQYSKENGGSVILNHQKSIPVSKNTKSNFLNYLKLYL